MRLLALAVSLFLLQAAVSPGAVHSDTAPLGASVDNMRFGKGARIAFVRILNTSGKDISGLNLSIDVTYQHGQYHYERILDFAPKIIAHNKLGLEDNGALHPDTAIEERLDLPIRGGANNLALAVAAKVDVVAYADSTVDVENEPALSRLMSLRNNRALADQKAAEIINAAAANSVTPNPRGMALAELRVLLEQAKRKQGEHELETELLSIIEDLERHGPETSSADLRQYASEKFRDSEAMTAHVLLRRSR
jgi:hypothetical protein